MERPFVLLAAIAPALAVLAYGIVKTRGDWRSDALWSALLTGAVAAITAATIELALASMLRPERFPPLAGAAVSALAIAALPEEAVKFIVLVFMAERHPDLRRRQDIAVAALGVAGGFAALENFFYLIAPGEWLEVAGLRAVTAVPGHAIDGLAMGSLLTWARLKPDRAAARLALALAVPVVLHAGYDFPLFVLDADNSAVWAAWAWLAIMALSALIAILLFNGAIAAARADDRRTGRGDGLMPDRRALAGAGAALLLLVAALAPLWRPLDAAPLRGGWALAILPAALGLDLLAGALRRRRATPSA